MRTPRVMGSSRHAGEVRGPALVPVAPRADGAGRAEGSTKGREPCAALLDSLADGCTLMGGQVFHDNQIARMKPRCKNLLNAGEEHPSVHGTVVDGRRNHTSQVECAREDDRLPVPVWHAGSP